VPGRGAQSAVLLLLLVVVVVVVVAVWDSSLEGGIISHLH
jgi:hypothetical protein